MSQLIELADFIGLWRLERRIHDHLGPTGHLTGTATFTPEQKVCASQSKANSPWAKAALPPSGTICGTRIILRLRFPLTMGASFTGSRPKASQQQPIGVIPTNTMSPMISPAGRNGPPHGWSKARAKTTRCTQTTCDSAMPRNC